METVEKISLRSVVGNVKAPEEGMKRSIMTWRGILTGKKIAQSNSGPSLVLLGKFEAMNVEKNSAFVSSMLQLPNEALTPLHDFITRDDMPLLAAELRLFVVGDKKSLTKYRVEAEAIRAPSEIDLASYFAAVSDLPAGQHVPDMSAPGSEKPADEQAAPPVQGDIEGADHERRKRRA